MDTPGQLIDLLSLRAAPVALTFCETPPPNVPRVDSAAPSGCTYWKRAAEGQTFYTEASDHFGCPVGAYTHGLDLPPERAQELESVVGTMMSLDYIRADEVQSIPRRDGGFRVAVYAPLTDAPCEPDVVIVRGNAKQIMLLAEAAQAAGGMMGRPTCAAIPHAMQSNTAVTSFGCIGNRVYTELGDDELYFVIPGTQVNPIVEKLATIVNANRELEQYHRARAR